MVSLDLQDILYPKFRFRVRFRGTNLVHIGATMALETSFSEVTGLKTGINASDNTTIKTSVSKLPDGRIGGTLVLKRGVILLTAIRNWVSLAVDKSMFYTLDVQVQLLNSMNIPSITWVVHNAFPLSLEVEGFSSQGNDVLMETLTLSYSGMTTIP